MRPRWCGLMWRDVGAGGTGAHDLTRHSLDDLDEELIAVDHVVVPVELAQFAADRVVLPGVEDAGAPRGPVDVVGQPPDLAPRPGPAGGRVRVPALLGGRERVLVTAHAGGTREVDACGVPVRLD